MAKISSAFVADPELMAELEKIAQPIAAEPGTVIFRQGEDAKGVFLLRKGTARLTSSSDGAAVLRVDAGAGSLLGVPAVIGEKPYSLTAEAGEGAEISVLRCEQFLHLMHTDAKLSFGVLQVLAEEVRFARESLIEG